MEEINSPRKTHFEKKSSGKTQSGEVVIDLTEDYIDVDAFVDQQEDATENRKNQDITGTGTITIIDDDAGTPTDVNKVNEVRTQGNLFEVTDSPMIISSPNTDHIFGFTSPSTPLTRKRKLDSMQNSKSEQKFSSENNEDNAIKREKIFEKEHIKQGDDGNQSWKRIDSDFNANKEYDSEQLLNREKGNSFFKKFLESSAGDCDRASARDNLLSAMAHYEAALEISMKHGIHHGAMSASKNLAVTAGYIAQIEVNNNNKLARFKEAIKYFSQSLSYCRQVRALDNFQWRLKLIPGMKKVVESFFIFLQESEIEDDVKNKVCEGFVKGFNDWSQDWVELSIMAEVRVKQAEMLNNLAVVNISDKIFKAGLCAIAEAWRPLELAKKYVKRLTFVSNSAPITTEIQILGKRLSSKSLKGVSDAIKEALIMKDEVKEVEKLKMIVEEVEELKKDFSLKDLHDELKRLEHILEAGDNISEDLQEIWKECTTHKAVGEGLQMASQGEEMFRVAVAGDETLKMEMVWDAMDMFKQAIILSAGEEIELEAMAKGKIGIIYLKVLDNKPQARDYLTEAMDTAKVMMLQRNINMYDLSWYAEVAEGYKRLQGEKVRREDEEWMKERSPLLEDPHVKIALKSLEDHSDDLDEEFAKFLFDFLPPKHRGDCESLKKSLETGFVENRKKMLQKMVTFWHPDRVRKEDDKKHYIICEEVTKRLTNRYNLFTCGA